MSFQPGLVLNTNFGNVPEDVEVPQIENRAPTQYDTQQGMFPLGKRWIYVGNSTYELVSYTSTGGQLLAQWIESAPIGGSGIQTVTGNSGGAAGPDSHGNFNILGTAGVSVTTNPSTNTATISISSSGITFNDVATSTLATVDTGYFATAALTLTLPASPTQGQFIIAIVDTTGSVVLQANTGQFIRSGSGISSSGGSATNNARGDALTLYFRAANSTWISTATEGTWDLA